MQIENRINIETVKSMAPMLSGVRRTEPATDTATLERARALEQEFSKEADVRAEYVERAMNLIPQVQWPPTEVIRRIANLIAARNGGGQ